MSIHAPHETQPVSYPDRSHWETQVTSANNGLHFNHSLPLVFFQTTHRCDGVMDVFTDHPGCKERCYTLAALIIPNITRFSETICHSAATVQRLFVHVTRLNQFRQYGADKSFSNIWFQTLALSIRKTIIITVIPDIHNYLSQVHQLTVSNKLHVVPHHKIKWLVGRICYKK